MTREQILHPILGNVKSCSINSLNVPSFENLLTEPRQLNPYTYAVNNPILYVDPLGLSCGAGWKQIFVPNNWFGWYSFEGPCTTHDNCYGCEGKKMGKAKSTCDSEFYRGMLNVCNSLSQGSYWKNHCNGTASIYYDYVRKNGQPYFDKARKECCEIK